MTEQTTRTRQIHLPPPRVVTAPAVTVEASIAHVHGEALRSQLETLIGKHRDIVSLAQDTVKIAAGLSRVVAVAYFANNPAGTLRVAANNWSGFAFDRDEFRKGVSAVCTRAATTKDRETFVSADTKNLTTLCLPINVRNAPSDVLAVSLATTREQLNTIDLGGVEMIVSGLRIWHSERCAIERDAELQGLAALVELVGQVERSKSVTQACHAIANELRDFLGCHRVALGLRKRTHAGCRLKTLSGAASFDQYSDVARQFQMACDESAIRETLAAWPSLNPNAEHTTIALRQLAEQQNVEATIGLPLLNEHELVGVLILAGRKESLLEAKTLNLLQTAAPILASALRVNMRLEGGLLHRSWRRFATSRWTTRIAVTTLVGTAVAVLCTPWPYSMKVSCTLEPMTRRIVSAPYDGLVETSLTEPGSVVQQGQILARMDAREIRWELATVTAERSHALKEADTELSRENIGKAQLAHMEAEGLKRKLELLQYREQNHELVSPIEGMVLNGSLEKLTGAPVKTGQPLFEVAELNPLRLELAVPAEDYFHIKSGQSVSVAFDGFEGESFEGTIVRIRPRSEIRDEKNVFVAEMEVPNSDFRLRPGIQGYATITGDKHSIAWNTFHKAWESLWRTDPSAILAENSDIGSSTMDLVAQSRRAKQQASEKTQMAIRAEPDPTKSGLVAPVTRIVEAPREQLRQE